MYRAYGLTLESAIELPELAKLESVEERPTSPDVQICLGEVPEYLPGRPVPRAWLDAVNDVCLLRFNGIGRFLVERGEKITIQKEEQTSFDDLRGFLLGSVIAAVVHQRGMIPLHISAVLTPRGAIAFTGDSGAGKSTMVAHLNRAMGWPLISDDVSRVFESTVGYEIESGVHTVKLWKDALNSLGRTSSGLRRDLTRYDKFHAIDSNKFTGGNAPLHALVQLKWGDSHSTKRLTGRRAFEAVLNSVYRPEVGRMCGNRDRIVEAAMSIAGSISVHELERPKQDHIESGMRDSISQMLESEMFA